MKFQTPYLRSVLTITLKDLRAESRARELVNAMLLFAVISLLVFSFALELDREARESTVGGILWMIIAYAGTLGLGRSLSAEKDKGSLDALLLSPINRSALFYGKMISNFLFTLAVGLMMMGLLTFLFDVNLILFGLLAIVLLGCLGFACTGTLVASMSVHARAREMLLPILLLPVILPIILSAARASVSVISGLSADKWLPWLQTLAFIDLVYLLAGYFLFDVIVEE